MLAAITISAWVHYNNSSIIYANTEDHCSIPGTYNKVLFISSTVTVSYRFQYYCPSRKAVDL